MFQKTYLHVSLFLLCMYYCLLLDCCFMLKYQQHYVKISMIKLNSITYKYWCMTYPENVAYHIPLLHARFGSLSLLGHENMYEV